MTSTIPLRPQAWRDAPCCAAPAGLVLGGGIIAAGATAAQAATSQNGWSAGSSSQISLSGLTLGSASFPAGVRSGEVHTILGYVASGTFTATQRGKIRAIVDYCDGVVRWGGDYSGRRDEMHFEINVRPGDARLAALVTKIGGGSGGGAPIAWTRVKRGASGFRVVAVQHLLNHRGHLLTVDGAFGPTTESKVIAFQKGRGLVGDGIVGEKTWAKLTA